MEREGPVDKLKEALTTAPVFILPGPQKDKWMTTDASKITTGGIFMKEGRVIAYDSKKMNDAEQHYPMHDQELLAC